MNSLSVIPMRLIIIFKYSLIYPDGVGEEK